jgi:predicted homoserine dehydrogenase-like protein
MSGYLMRVLADRVSPIKVGILGTGVMGTAIAKRIDNTLGMTVSRLVSRHARPSVVTEGTDVVVDASGDVSRGTTAALAAIAKGIPFLSFSAETDATVGPALANRARQAGTVYGVADGDQPGCMLRMYAEAQLYGWDVVGLITCKGFLDHAKTPRDMEEWVAKAAGTRPQMLCSFADGTKMQLEQNVVANCTGYLPTIPGMQGVPSTLATAARDLSYAVRGETGFLAYTLGGDFGGGVGMLIRDRDDSEGALATHYKLGGGPPGPMRYVHRTFHGCHFEVPVSVAEAVYLPAQIPGPFFGPPAGRTIAVAKQTLFEGQELDGIGGFKTRGELRREPLSGDLLPIGLSKGAILRRGIHKDGMIRFADVDLAPDMAIAHGLFLEQTRT